MMAHNIWHHINAVQEANRKYDAGLCPKMLVAESFDRVYFKDVVNAIFSTSNKGIALELLEEFDGFWTQIIGTRGASGKSVTNAQSKFEELFDIVEEDSVELEEELFTDTQIDRLEELELETEDDTA